MRKVVAKPQEINLGKRKRSKKLKEIKKTIMKKLKKYFDPRRV